MEKWKKSKNIAIVKCLSLSRHLRVQPAPFNAANIKSATPDSRQPVSANIPWTQHRVDTHRISNRKYFSINTTAIIPLQAIYIYIQC